MYTHIASQGIIKGMIGVHRASGKRMQLINIRNKVLQYLGTISVWTVDSCCALDARLVDF